MNFKLTLLIFLLSFNSYANESLVRKHFAHIAKKVIAYSPELKVNLKNIVIIVSQEQLIDNRGSNVDALGIPGEITLYKKAWLNFYRKGIDVRLLTLHELLRASNINDNDFKISLPIMNIIYSRDITQREETPYCNLNVQTHDRKKETLEIYAEGLSSEIPSISSENNRTVLTYNRKGIKISHDNAISRGEQECKNMKFESFQSLGHSYLYQESTDGWNTSKFSKTKIHGNCIRYVKNPRNDNSIKKEWCSKLRQCLTTTAIYPNTKGKQNLIEQIEEIKIERGCK